MMQPNVITIYTDGGCRLTNGPGAWAWRAEYPDGTYREEVGHDLCATNNRMEMTAALRAIEALMPRDKALIVTDSQYLQQGFMSWVKGWRARGWRTASDGEVKNVDLWKSLLKAAEGKDIQFTWVKGHNGTPSNERVDRLCSAEIRRITGKKSRFEKRKNPTLRCPVCQMALSLVEVAGRPHWTCIGWKDHDKEAEV